MVLIQKSQPEKELIFLKHLTQDPWWKSDILEIMEKENKLTISLADIVKYHPNRLICPHCERGIYRWGKKDWARCNFCGHQGPSITTEKYINEKMYAV